MNTGLTSTLSSGNVFADLGLPQADDLLTRADLLFDIYAVIEEKRLAPAAIARALDIPLNQARKLAEADASDCPVGCLQKYLDALRRVPDPSYASAA